MSFLLFRSPEADANPLREREATGMDLERRTETILLPDTIPVPRSSPPKARTATDFIIETTVPTGTIPGGSFTNPEDDMTFIPAPNVGGSGLRIGGPTIPGGSGPTFPDPGGFTPAGGGGFGDALSGALAGLLNRGAEELADKLFGGPDAPGPGSAVPGTGLQAPTGSGGPCPGIGSIRGPDGTCINLGDLGPGGAPAITPRQATPWQPTMGLYGVGVAPLPVQSVKRDCPPGFVLGKDNICYDGLPKSKRKWNPGRKPLLTGGEMNAITKATRAARRLESTKKSLKKTSKALKKAGC